MEIRRGRHCVFALHVHLVFVTKYRKKVFQKPHLDTLKNIFYHVCQEFEATLEEMEGEEDHVHLLVTYPPKVTVSKLVNSLKGVSSRKLKQGHEDIQKRYYKGKLWSPSYFAGSCGGAPLSVIKEYIQNQNTPN